MTNEVFAPQCENKSRERLGLLPDDQLDIVGVVRLRLVQIKVNDKKCAKLV